MELDLKTNINIYFYQCCQTRQLDNNTVKVIALFKISKLKFMRNANKNKSYSIISYKFLIFHDQGTTRPWRTETAVDNRRVPMSFVITQTLREQQGVKD